MRNFRFMMARYEDMKDFNRGMKLLPGIQEKGHSHHCACRQVWGDGECECDMYTLGYDPYAWMKGAAKNG